MKKTKKMLLTALSVALVAIIAVFGTVAYLTDTDSDVNVMTVGNVSIVQNEQQRVEADGEFTSKLEPFKQGKILMPVTYPGGRTADNVTIGDYVLELSDKEANYVDKIISVTNDGKSDAYVRTLVAVPTGGDDWESTPVAASDCWLHWNIPAGYDNHWTLVGTNVPLIEVDGKGYYVWEFIHKEALEPGETTYPSVRGFYMDQRVNNDENGYFLTYADGTTKRIADFGFEDTVDILVVSQAVQADGFADATTALDAGFGDVTADNAKAWFGGVEFPILVEDAEDLETILGEASDAGSGDTTIHITDDIDMTGVEWAPLKVDGYHGADIVTIEGNGHTITGLNAPLFAGGFAGGSGIVIKDLTIADSNIVTTNDQGAGAFIECADSMDVITLENCHLLNSTLTANTTDGSSRMGGLVGWTAGYNNQNDGPVKSYVTIKDCSVIDSELSCAGSVGGIIGHSGGNEWTYTTIENCTVKNNTLTSNDDSYRVGVVVGTANVGEMTINNITSSGNTLKQINGDTEISRPTGQLDLYGRFVPGTTGKLTIDGNNVSSTDGVEGVSYAATQNELDGITIENNDTVVLGSGSYIIPDSAQGKTLTITGNGDTVVATQDDGSYEGCDYSLQGSTVTFNNITITTDSSTYTGYARLNATYNDCTINGTYTLYGNSVFNNCTFNVSGDAYNIWTWGAPTATFNNCTFNSDGKALLLYGTVNTKLTVNDCTFNDNGGLTDLKAAIEIGNDYGTSYELIVNNTVVNGYEINDKGIGTSTTLWANKNSMGTDKLSVVVDGVDVY